MPLPENNYPEKHLYVPLVTIRWKIYSTRRGVVTQLFFKGTQSPFQSESSGSVNWFWSGNWVRGRESLWWWLESISCLSSLAFFFFFFFWTGTASRTLGGQHIHFSHPGFIIYKLPIGQTISVQCWPACLLWELGLPFPWQLRTPRTLSLHFPGIIS